MKIIATTQLKNVTGGFTFVGVITLPVASVIIANAQSLQ